MLIGIHYTDIGHRPAALVAIRAASSTVNPASGSAELKCDTNLKVTARKDGWAIRAVHCLARSYSQRHRS